MVIFGGDINAIRSIAREGKIEKNVVIDKDTGRRMEMEYKNNLYYMPMWVKRRVRKDTVNAGMGEEENDEDSEEEFRCQPCEGNRDDWGPF